MNNVKQLVECVPNFSEGRNMEIINQITNVIKEVKGVKLMSTQEKPQTEQW